MLRVKSETLRDEVAEMLKAGEVGMVAEMVAIMDREGIVAMEDPSQAGMEIRL